MIELAETIREAALDEEFTEVGIAPAVPSEGFADLVRWIEKGYAAGMNYFSDRLHAYEHPSGVLTGAKSIVVLMMPYAGSNPNHNDPTSEPEGRIARYTWQGNDYHDVIHPKLKRLCRLIKSCHPDANARGVVDTAPIMEREVAQLAGLGWRGKNTLLLNKFHGSYFFLACILVDIELPVDEPQRAHHCGQCTACLDACPTDAFPQAGVLDASRCISYLTIEHRGLPPVELRQGIGDWLFGCDVCQEVCPWNRKPTRRADQAKQETDTATIDRLMNNNGHMSLTWLFRLNDDDFRTKFRKTPAWRTKRQGMLRNAAIVLGNWLRDHGRNNTIELAKVNTALQQGLTDQDLVVQEACLWALQQNNR